LRGSTAEGDLANRLVCSKDKRSFKSRKAPSHAHALPLAFAHALGLALLALVLSQSRGSKSKSKSKNWTGEYFLWERRI
jgi:hypothetical protein